jgi:hypothetical protein
MISENLPSRLHESRGRSGLGHDNHRPRLLHCGVTWQTPQTARLLIKSGAWRATEEPP